jgi:hypothetical protein
MKPINMKQIIILWIIGWIVTGICHGQTFHEKVTIKVDITKEIGKFDPAWTWFGYDEPNYTTMKDGLKLLTELSEMSPAPVYIRTHNLLTTGDGTPALKWGSTNAYTEDSLGNPVYNWTLIDGIFDALIARGMKPFVEIGFMPEAMSVKPEPYRHPTTIFTPAGLIRRKITSNGENLFTGGCYTPWKDTAVEKSNRGTGRYGTNPILGIGPVLLKSFVNYTILRLMQSKGRSLLQKWEVRKPPIPGHPTRKNSLFSFWNIAPRG